MNRRHRLKHPRDFARVRAQGDSWAHRLVVLAAVPNGRDDSRFGFVASKRLGKAVKRNRAKRLLREAVRQNIHVVPSGWDCVFIARPPLSGATFAETEAAVTQLLKRASLGRSPALENRAGSSSSFQPRVILA
jgi:ribonuclease P protein component